MEQNKFGNEVRDMAKESGKKVQPRFFIIAYQIIEIIDGHIPVTMPQIIGMGTTDYPPRLVIKDMIEVKHPDADFHSITNIMEVSEEDFGSFNMPREEIEVATVKHKDLEGNEYTPHSKKDIYVSPGNTEA